VESLQILTRSKKGWSEAGHAQVDGFVSGGGSSSSVATVGDPSSSPSGDRDGPSASCIG
jgi:hypothetical protein